MKKDIRKQNAKKDIFVIFLTSLIPMVVYLIFESSWRSFHQDINVHFWYKFALQCFISYCLAGLGFTIVMLWRKEKFSHFGLLSKNTLVSIVLSAVVFLPHFIFLMVTKGYHGYAPMSGAILYDSIMQRPFLQQLFCMVVVFAIWGFCEGFTYVYIGRKVNDIFPIKNQYLNWGAIIGGTLCVMMHGGIALNWISIFDAITMFLFVYGILTIKDITNNAWGCVASFLFLWNAFP